MTKITPNARSNRGRLLEDENYYQYYLEREEILKKYPPFKKMSREDFKCWCVEIFNLLHDVNGNFEKFMKSNISDAVELQMERDSRNRLKKRNML